MRTLAPAALAVVAACSSAPPPSPPAAPATPPSAAATASPPALASSAPPADKSPTPVASAKPPTAVQGSLRDLALDDRWRAHATCAKPTCELSLPDAAAKLPGAPVAVLHLTTGPSGWTLPRDPRVEVTLVVTKGTVSVASGARGRAVEVGAWSAAPLGDGGVTLRGDGRVVLVVASADGRPLADALTGPRSAGAPSPATAITPVAIEPLEDLAWGGGAYHARIIRGGEKERAAVSVIVFSPDASVKAHVHEKEWECLSVQRGEGTLTLEDGDVRVEPGNVVCVPPGRRHAWTPRGDAPLVAVQVYSPGGPEQRFKKLARP